MAKLVEIDWSGIEAVIVGWLSHDPDYIRLAWLGVHDFLCSHAVHRPASLEWPIDQLLEYFAEIKKDEPEVRDQSKRMVHGTNYLETVEGIYKRFRKLFKSFREASDLQATYYSIAPKLKPWQLHVQNVAYEHEYLGGTTGPYPHPYGYRHEFYNVREFRLISDMEAVRRKRLGLPCSAMNGRSYAVEPGEDAKRAVAYFPQSIAAGIIRESSLILFDPENPDYVGDLFFGRTPLRAIIHDSFLNEVPDRKVDLLIERYWRVMTRLIDELPLPPEWNLGSHLQFGVEVKVGQDWQDMEKVKMPQPWLALLKGEAPPAWQDRAAALTVDMAERSFQDEDLDYDEDRDETFDPPDVLELGAGAGTSGAAASDDDIPF